jgi:xylulose-5-phosphate/fructose-6-phosphate phosphoketolase
MAATVERCILEIRKYQQEARKKSTVGRPRWPMIVLRSPKGWTAPVEVEANRLEGFWRAHQVPLVNVKKDPEQLRILENWMRSQRPEELFDGRGEFAQSCERLHL